MKDLEPSQIANYRYRPGVKEEQLIRRGRCAEGTRIRILDNIAKWANDSTPESETVYWLFGSGKSTIAYTVASQFDPTGSSIDRGNNTTILGANFFCSRQFDETRDSKWIVRTIAYQLAAACPSFREALSTCDLDSIHWDTRAQLENLLFNPWLASSQARREQGSTYLIIIDALDEVAGTGGSEFLEDLLAMIDEYKFTGLKFFVTSRPDPELAIRIDSFRNKQLYRLETVPRDEAEADIHTYLITSLPHLAKDDELIMKLTIFADGLFISAATVVRYLPPRRKTQHRTLLQRLFAEWDHGTSSSGAHGATALLDQLYSRVLSDAFADIDEDYSSTQLHILHTFLCSAEPISGSIAARLLPPRAGDDDTYTQESVDSDSLACDMTTDLLEHLHAVLYLEHGKVLSYHKSFPDFIFDHARSGRFWCDRNDFNRQLTMSCFSVMESGLCFNIANIPSSHLLDAENPTLKEEVNRRIQPPLRYVCQNWSHHLAASAPQFDPLLGIVSDFLKLRVLFWIEAMNLLQLTGQCDPALRTARDVLSTVYFTFL